MTRAAVALVGLALLSGCGSSAHTAAPSTFSPPPVTSDTPSTTPTTVATAPPTAIGKPFDVTDVNGDEATVTVTSIAVHTTAGDQYSEAPANGEYLVVAVSQITTSGSFPFNPSYFVVEDRAGDDFTDSDGNAFDSGYGNGVTEARTLSTGQHVSATIVFDVKRGHGTVEFQPADTVIGGWSY